MHPPVDTARFSPGRVGDHYLIVSELMPHKQIDVAIAAFNPLRLPLIVVGDGPDSRRLRAAGRARRSSFAGRLTDAEVATCLQGARALVVTSVEEFGIARSRAQAAGRPVIARRGGGALETVVDGVTGCFWSGGPDELARPCSRSTTGRSTPPACVEQRRALRYRVVPPRHAAGGRAAQRGDSRPGDRRPPAAGLDPAGQAGRPGPAPVGRCTARRDQDR